MAEERLDLSPDYDPEAPPADVTGRAPRGRGELIAKLKRLRTINYQAALLKERRDALMRELVPSMRQSMIMLDPITGKPMIAVAQQAKPIQVKVEALRSELYNHFFNEEVASKLDGMKLEAYREEIAMEVEVIVGDVLKPPEVDTTEDGLFVQAVEAGRIPLEVVAKVAKEVPRSAFVSFPKAPTLSPKSP